MTAVNFNPNRKKRLHRTTTVENLNDFDRDQTELDKKELNLTQLMNAITNVPNIVQMTAQKHKLFQTKVPTLKTQRKTAIQRF